MIADTVYLPLASAVLGLRRGREVDYGHLAGYDPKCVFQGFGEPREGATGDEANS